MYNMEFLDKGLRKIKNQNVTINMYGMIKFKLDIVNFDFKIFGNKLKIIDGKEEVLVIDFNEVSKINKVGINQIEIFFNINQIIMIEWRSTTSGFLQL